MPSAKPLLINLALQGGGAHGALSWGALDRLLEGGRLAPAALSGTSAGAMNAVALAQGWLDGGPEGARAALSRFWQAVAASVPAEASLIAADGLAARLSPMVKLLLHWTQYLSPELSNPLDLNPLRDIVTAQFDFERLRASPGPALFIATTRAQSGQLRLFDRKNLSADALLASACLPTVFRAVEIDGEPHWDGGYSANPPVLPLLQAGRARDTLLLLLNPLQHAGPLRSAAQIQHRALDMSFHGAFLREMSLLAAWQQQARQHWLPLDRWTRQLASARFHLIDGGTLLAGLPQDSRLVVHPAYFQALREQGRALAGDWLERHGSQLGRRGTVELSERF
ncbi:MAG TPA: patatin-like phospholipase family protein [Ideonella sp.]|uniref:patatin-like phospholipase family protein n=1 Tax=Ideonella sp. TaxID=1929293 RepID=UPI002C8D4D4C|nr:patatin-like phospholipase family protein [Ideonella sp.]HSI50318.1 patatin-like phospholipase family protein [Ideonella sp.]